MERLTKADESRLRAEASAHHKSSSDSFDRCDTDGFETQFCSDLSGRLASRRADIAAEDGLAEFPALFTLTGERVRARVIDTRFGLRWLVRWKDGAASFLPFHPARATTLGKYGLVEGREMAAADAKIGAPANARGFSGLGSCYIETFRLERDELTRGVFADDLPGVALLKKVSRG